MANKAISELPQAQNVNNQDLFVLEQSGIAKKLTAETFITEQGIIDALAEALDGHGGISSVTLSSVSGRIRTYLITFTDGSATTFQVLDGTSIDRIVKTSTAGLTDTYTVFMSDGTTTFFTVTNGADGSVSEAMLNNALKDKAPAVTETTESSAIANFTDGADDLVMHNIVAEIAPVQSGSGDPSPSNIRPISGWTGCNVTRTGKNLFNKDALNSTSDYTKYYKSYWYTDPIFLKANTTYTMSPTSTASLGVSDYYVLYINNDASDPEYMSGGGTAFKYPVTAGTPTTVSFTTGATGTIRFAVTTVASAPSQSALTAFMSIDYQIEVGSTATTYEPYIAPTTVSLSWQTEAGTVYGGTIDVATGLLTVDRAMVDLGTLTWVASETGSGRYYAAVNGIKLTAPRTLEIICSCFKPNVGGGAFENCSIYNVDSRLYAVNNNFIDDSSGFTESVTEQVAVYPLATPQTYQLTPQEVKTLLGMNNVWADTGNVSVTYPADTKMFIEKLTMPTEDDLVANQAITSGKYFMIGNSLYLALANIASGAQITIGTNAQRVSLADALNTINA